MIIAQPFSKFNKSGRFLTKLKHFKNISQTKWGYNNDIPSKARQEELKMKALKAILTKAEEIHLRLYCRLTNRQYVPVFDNTL